MKKYIYKSLALVLLATAFTSCLKDDSLILDPAKGVNVIEFANPAQIVKVGTIHPMYSFSYDLGPDITLPIEVSYSGPEATAPQDITVNFAAGTQANIAAYNTQNTTTYELMSSSSYSLPVTKVVIAKGESKAKFNVTFKPSTFDLTKALVLPLTISSASFGTVSGNFNTILLSVGAKNKWDGIYAYSGNIQRNSAAGPDPALSGTLISGIANRSLVTLGPNTVSFSPLWATGGGVGGIDGTFITINADNTCTMASSNATLKNTPGLPNKYDPATKTFDLAFDWGTGANTRVTVIKLKYIGPRP